MPEFMNPVSRKQAQNAHFHKFEHWILGQNTRSSREELILDWKRITSGKKVLAFLKELWPITNK